MSCGGGHLVFLIGKKFMYFLRTTPGLFTPNPISNYRVVLNNRM